MARSNSDDNDEEVRIATQVGDYADGTRPSKPSPDGDRPFIINTDDRHGRVTVAHPAGAAEAGFDLTEFSGAESFEQFLENHGLDGPYPVPSHPSQTKPDIEAGDLKGWVWADKYVLVLTCANPLTGVRARMRRQPEPGYAAYIGIMGQRASVEAVFHALRRRATFYKGSNRTHSEYIR